jgi:hypothetical protein
MSTIGRFCQSAAPEAGPFSFSLGFSFRRQLPQQPFCNKDRRRATELRGLAAAGRPNGHQAHWRHAVRAFDQSAKEYGVELSPNSKVSFHVVNLIESRVAYTADGTCAVILRSL